MRRRRKSKKSTKIVASRFKLRFAAPFSVKFHWPTNWPLSRRGLSLLGKKGSYGRNRLFYRIFERKTDKTRLKFSFFKICWFFKISEFWFRKTSERKNFDFLRFFESHFFVSNLRLFKNYCSVQQPRRCEPAFSRWRGLCDSWSEKKEVERFFWSLLYLGDALAAKDASQNVFQEVWCDPASCRRAKIDPESFFF